MEVSTGPHMQDHLLYKGRPV